MGDGNYLADNNLNSANTRLFMIMYPVVGYISSSHIAFKIDGFIEFDMCLFDERYPIILLSFTIIGGVVDILLKGECELYFPPKLP